MIIFKVHLAPNVFGTVTEYKFPFSLDHHCEKNIVVAIFDNFV